MKTFIVVGSMLVLLGIPTVGAAQSGNSWLYAAQEYDRLIAQQKADREAAAARTEQRRQFEVMMNLQRQQLELQREQSLRQYLEPSRPSRTVQPPLWQVPVQPLPPLEPLRLPTVCTVSRVTGTVTCSE